MKNCCAQGLAPSKHPINVPLRRKTKMHWRGEAWQRDELGDNSNTTTQARSPKHRKKETKKIQQVFLCKKIYMIEQPQKRNKKN